jgi:hypothetical protein
MDACNAFVWFGVGAVAMFVTMLCAGLVLWVVRMGRAKLTGG